MSKNFQVGDHVCWNSEAGHMSGRIIKIHTHDTEFKGHPCHASKEGSQFRIQSDRTEHIATHKDAVLHKIH